MADFFMSDDAESIGVELAIIRPLIDHLTRCHNHNFIVQMDYTPPRLVLNQTGLECAKKYLKAE